MRTRSELVVLVVNPALQTKITLARKSFTVDFPTIIVIVKFFPHKSLVEEANKLVLKCANEDVPDTSWITPTLLGLLLSTMPVSLFKMSRALVCFAFTFLAAAAADFVPALLLSGVAPESSIPMLLQWDRLSECFLGPSLRTGSEAASYHTARRSPKLRRDDAIVDEAVCGKEPT